MIVGDKMNIKWFSKENNKSAITVHSNNITLSKNASDLFNGAYGILFGVDNDTNSLIMKKVSTEQIENNEYKKDEVYILTIKPTYGRVNSKQLISLLSEHYDFDFKKNQSYKFDAKWHNGENMLIVNMNGGR